MTLKYFLTGIKCGYGSIATRSSKEQYYPASCVQVNFETLHFAGVHLLTHIMNASSWIQIPYTIDPFDRCLCSNKVIHILVGRSLLLQMVKVHEALYLYLSYHGKSMHSRKTRSNVRFAVISFILLPSPNLLQSETHTLHTLDRVVFFSINNHG